MFLYSRGRNSKDWMENTFDKKNFLLHLKGIKIVELYSFIMVVKEKQIQNGDKNK